MDFKEYDSGNFFDELFDNQGTARNDARLLVEAIERLPEGDLRKRQDASETAMHNMGITFNVYGDQAGTERTIPFDIVPRIINGTEWNAVEAGLKQRIQAVNRFIDDIYHRREIIADGVIPEWLFTSSKGYLPQCQDLNPPKGVWAHITGTDLVRDENGTFFVLEDNLRVPSGVSYVLLNRVLMKRNFPEVFHRSQVRRVVDYPDQLNKMLHYLAPEGMENPTVAVLTPGMYNSAYFEHAFLARQMGAQLVEGRDLVYDGKYVCAKTTNGLKRIDVIYRRIDDDFIDPEVFRPDSALGCRGLMTAYREGRLTLANAPGTGVADDKVVYAFVPDMIRYYLGEEPLLPNVPTHLCYDEKALEYTLDNLEELVVKPASESGGYGILIGPRSTEKERNAFVKVLRENPRNYISQPTLTLSRAPVLVDDHFEGRHVDLRPFILHRGDDSYVLPGGLTRVALKKGSLVVNSSQGGGTKDTWVVDLETGMEAASC
ncbi:MAG: circularly permuted type 2 ATP-grasp protein [Pontiellaceae bacterium]|nr:circularly permuted type 2 ATP-grasp protein [Pontiellaceae bacterium]MBN2783467.1 circularly permuted type 2 ATP-grasp protein [Pontiellaceae bacterium]